MTRAKAFALSLMALLVFIGVAACGGGSSGLLDSELSLSDDTFVGITEGEFKAVRYNDAGYRDGSLNPTLDLQSVTNGDLTTVTISVDDADPMYGVALDLHYDASRYAPEEFTFGGLIESGVELGVTRVRGLVALGQVDLSEAVRSGEFATVTFRLGAAPTRTLSAAHSTVLNDMYDPTQLAAGNHLTGFAVPDNTATDGTDAQYTLYSWFATADGNDDSETNIGDITPMIAYGNYGVVVSDTNFAPAVTDYDGNGEVNISDLTPIGIHLGEVTTSVEILLGDGDTFATGDAAWQTFTWDEGNAPARPPVTDTVDWGTIWRTWNGAVTQANMEGADTNADGSVYISARANDGTAVTDAFTGVELTYQPFVQGLVVTDYDVQIQNATGGSGVGGVDDFEDGDTATVVANQDDLVFNITGIYGTYDDGGGPQAFTPADRGGLVPEADYDQGLADAAAETDWTVGTAGAAGMRLTAPVIDLSASSGTGLTGVVFPDDDPESDPGTPEGALNINMKAAGTFIPSAKAMDLDIDVTDDPLAPEVIEILTAEGQDVDNNWFLSSVGNTLVTVWFEFGTGGAPGDLGTVGAELYDFNDPLSPIALTNVGAPPANAGEFDIQENLDPGDPGTHSLIGLIGINVIPGHFYFLRIYDVAWTSVNKPGEFYKVAEPPALVIYETLPGPDNYGPDNDFMRVFHPDPKLRRDPRVIIDVIGASVDPVDPVGYADIIKESGGQFAISVYGALPDPTLFPQIIVIEGTDPATIGPTTVGESVIMAYVDPGMLVVDIAAITTPGGPGDLTEYYAFKVFGAGDPWVARGTGTFNYEPSGGIDPGSPVGVDWGVNIFSDVGRGDLALGARDYGTKIVDGNTVETTTPDVIFVEFSAGEFGGWNETAPRDTNNVRLVFDHESLVDYWVPLDVRVAGLSVVGDVIAVHPVTADDFRNPGMPGWLGNFDPGESYTVWLDDPTLPGLDDDFDDAMTVVGTNPNL